MTDHHERSPGEWAARERSGRVLGWLSGLGLLVLPWIAAGVLATVGTMGGPESWDAERTFPWLLLVTLVAGLGWVVYGCVPISGFRRGALPGAAVRDSADGDASPEQRHTAAFGRLSVSAHA